MARWHIRDPNGLEPATDHVKPENLFARKLSLAAGAANGNYFDALTSTAWASYATNTLSITLARRTFTATAAAHHGQSFVVHQPSTQDILACSGTVTQGAPGSLFTLKDENSNACPTPQPIVDVACHQLRHPSNVL